MKKEHDINPYTHKLSCNIVFPTPGMEEGACNCRRHDPDCVHPADPPAWLKGSIIDTLCDCGVTYHHRDCPAFNHYHEGASYVLKECTCGFAQPTSATYEDDSVTELSGARDSYFEDELNDIPQWQLDRLNLTLSSYTGKQRPEETTDAIKQSEWQSSAYNMDKHENDRVVNLELTNPTQSDYNAAIALLETYRDKDLP